MPQKLEFEIGEEPIDIWSEPKTFRTIVITERETTVKENRNLYLKELRSDKWKKGCMKSDEKGNPIIETPEDADGTCACAIMIHLFDPTSQTSTRRSREALGLTGNDCYFIQHCLNDSSLSFSQIADILEKTVFRKVEYLENYQYGAGNILCKICGHPFSHHPNPKGHEYLTALCDGLLVKL